LNVAQCYEKNNIWIDQRRRIIMSTKQIKLIIIILCQVLLSLEINAQQDKSREIPFKDYRIIQYITQDGRSPHSVMNMDNNGEILLACNEGKTRDQLNDAGFSFSESQIALMEMMRLLEEKDDLLSTVIPFLDGDKTGKIRAHNKSVVPRLADYIRQDVAQLSGVLESMTRKNNIYSILFSYILDGMVWDMFEEKNLVKKMEITAKAPFWSGEVWAIYPARAFECGTNSITDKGVSFKVNWSEKTIPKMIPFVADWKNQLQMFNDYLEKGRVVNEEAKKVFAPFNLYDKDGYFTIPVIEEKEDNELYRISCAISEKVAERVPKILDLSGLTEKYGFRDNGQAMVIVYHEMMWDLMDYFEEEGLVGKPVAFASPEKVEQKDIADLVFIVRSGK